MKAQARRLRDVQMTEVAESETVFAGQRWAVRRPMRNLGQDVGQELSWEQTSFQTCLGQLSKIYAARIMIWKAY